jgi:oligopeptide transport system substrate-binding protein
MAMHGCRILCLFLIGAIVAGCTKNKSSDQALRIHFPSVKVNFDPQRMEDAYSMAIATQIYRGLLRYNTTGDIRADLAESWTESDDHRTYRFKLKKATFSDGSPITAKHVQMTFARLFRLGASMAADIDYIAGAREFKSKPDISKFGVKPISDDVVEFRLAEPSAIFLKQLAVADCAILPIADFRGDPEISSRGVFSGPYKITSNLQEGQITLEKWRSDAMDSARPPQKIHYSLKSSDPVQLALASEIDTLDHYRVSAEDKAKLEKAGWAAAATELAGEVFIVLNPERIPLEVRRALYAAVDSSEVITALGQKSYRAAYGLIPFGLSGELSSTDVAQLKGATNSLKRPITIELDYEGASDMEERTAQWLKKKWAGLGVELRLNPIAKGEKLEKLFGKKSQAILAKKAMDYPEGFSVLGYFKGKYESNYFYVNDSEVDKSLLQVLQIFDSDARAERYKQIQKQILKHYTIIPMFFGSEASGLWSAKVKSVPSHPLGVHTLPLESVEMSAE